ncbi:unnamed protein product [Nyctereutes procyonoides]|uniref:(raccoon dog) hypothetical protein n=1 Tax=Nyctereutes procyonoides TaxID=34880 RepID=A0A811ZSW7_NYCPR|nr:unnamed protein product [Nyctereutes procyonoides]
MDLVDQVVLQNIYTSSKFPGERDNPDHRTTAENSKVAAVRLTQQTGRDFKGTAPYPHVLQIPSLQNIVTRVHSKQRHKHGSVQTTPIEASTTSQPGAGANSEFLRGDQADAKRQRGHLPCGAGSSYLRDSSRVPAPELSASLVLPPLSRRCATRQRNVCLNPASRSSEPQPLRLCATLPGNPRSACPAPPSPWAPREDASPGTIRDCQRPCQTPSQTSPCDAGSWQEGPAFPRKSCRLVNLPLSQLDPSPRRLEEKGMDVEGLKTTFSRCSRRWRMRIVKT